MPVYGERLFACQPGQPSCSLSPYTGRGDRLVGQGEGFLTPTFTCDGILDSACIDRLSGSDVLSFSLWPLCLCSEYLFAFRPQVPVFPPCSGAYAAAAVPSRVVAVPVSFRWRAACQLPSCVALNSQFGGVPRVSRHSIRWLLCIFRQCLYNRCHELCLPNIPDQPGLWTATL